MNTKKLSQELLTLQHEVAHYYATRITIPAWIIEAKKTRIAELKTLLA